MSGQAVPQKVQQNAGDNLANQNSNPSGGKIPDWLRLTDADMVELVDTLSWGGSDCGRVSSSLTVGTKKIKTG